MTQLSALCYSFLKGETLSIMTSFRQFSMTNLPREVGRGVERRFGVSITRIPTKFISKYGHHGEYYKYRLEWSKNNLSNLKKMAKYISQQIGSPKTQQQQKMITNLKPLLK